VTGSLANRPESFDSRLELISGGLRLRFALGPDGRQRFLIEVLDLDGAPVAGSLPNVPVGGGLDLAAERVIADAGGLRPSGSGRGRGPDGEPSSYAWSASVRSCAGGGFEFEATIDLADPLDEPPAIELWLGAVSTMAHRQTFSFRRTFVAGPVRSTQGLAGNSVPAAYLFDPVTGIETILHVDAGALAWAPGRLLSMEQRELFEYGPSPRYGIGLVPTARFSLPAGRHVVRWRLWQRGLDAAPDSWEASARLVDTLATAFDGVGRPLVEDVTWERAAKGALADLLDADQSQVSVALGGEEVLGLRAYARDATHYYDHPADHVELMTVADVVAPLLLYLRLHPDEEAARLTDRLRQTLAKFHRPEARYISNGLLTDGVEPVADTWYFFLNGLIKIPWVALIARDPALTDIALDGLGGAERLADATGGRLPLFADFRPDTGPRSLGAAPNPSVAGLLAYAAVLGDDLGGTDGAGLARRLLIGLRQEPVGLCFHEPLQLGFAAAAAARLADAGDAPMATLAEAFVRTQLRMVYWDEDPEATAGGYAIRGMFEACASLLYPALKENIEAILPWTVLLRAGRGPTELLLQVMNLIRLHSFAFFDPLLPRPNGSAAPWIPYENLGTSELPGTGSIGKEIYGAGEVFWAYLLFEAMARADDSVILVVNTDLLEPASLRGGRVAGHRFVVYNPTTAPRRFHLVGRMGVRLPLELSARSWQLVDIGEEGA
jgi:hypothetical protein